MRPRVLSTVLLAVSLILILALEVAAAQDGPIQPYEKNPRYWQYEGEPVELNSPDPSGHWMAVVERL